MSRPPAWLVLGLALSPLARAGEPPKAADPAFFRSKVAPVLEARCLSCHGETGPKGGLDLSTAAGLRRGGKLGVAVVPGQPDASLLLEKVTGDPPEMPAKAAPLSPAQVSDLRRWVEAGAAWPEGQTLRDRHLEGVSWWAFEPLRRPEVPAVAAPGWARTPVDAFILDRLTREGLRPSPEADRRTLIRRLTYDLLGLPPTPGETAAFLRDDRPDAYERVVERLLASPAYGERWGRHWLDVAHYGDTHGYDKDKRRDHAWPYRDYVIRALNADMPYPRFAREQIAGDVLEPGAADPLIATGFIAAGPWDFVGHVELREGTVDKLKARLNDRDDMLANAMSTFQSLTVHCARCHDHKFDPIPQKDYYKLQAVFAGVDRGDRAYSTASLDARKHALEARRAALLERAAAAARSIAALASPDLARLEATLADLRKQLDASPKPAPDLTRPSPTNGYHSDIRAQPEGPAWVQVDLGAQMPVSEIRLIPARPTDFPDTPGFGFPVAYAVELADDPAFPPATTRVVATARRPDAEGAGDDPYLVRFEGAAPSARYVRVSAARLWKRTGDYVFALAELEVIARGENAALGKPVAALDSIEGGLWSRAALVDGFDSRGHRPPPDDPAESRRLRLLDRARQLAAERDRQAEALVTPTLRAERDAVAAELAGVETALRELRTTDLVYAVTPHEPRPIAVLKRGDVEQPGEAVGPGALSCLPGLAHEFALSDPADEGARRAALARWVTDPGNVLTWRSVVNRVWHFHFGRGIVDTPNDFGRNGSKPSHPELLDWLAAGFRDGGGSLKDLHRLLVRSAAYRQVSRGDRASEARDADNRWLWRMNRRRLDAESVRDGILAVTGTLDRAMGGPGFDLFRFKDDHSPVYDHTAPGVADNPAVRRRTVYRFAVRSVPNPFLESLDCADPNINTPVRTTTITALQALALLNDAFILSQSGEFARRLGGEGKPPAGQIEAAYELALGRPPTEPERDALTAFAARRGLAAACRVLLNTNEFMFID